MSQELEKKELEIKKAEDALLSPIGEINIPEAKPIADAEWCFQFFNNEPVVFGWQSENSEPSPLVLQLQPIESDVLTFRQNGMEFKIFARPISEDTKQIRKEQDASQN